ncbi:MAG: tetratricopeptide repeat protein, partial [Cyanobacteriota bacterium]|nr:tetratricopeptide repeat protein [Cyanobacteriota bacterium]
SNALRAIAGATGQLEKAEVAVGVLEKALTLAESIDDPNSQSSALSAIAEAYGQLEQDEVAVGVLEKALTLAESIDNPNSQSSALIAIAWVYGQLEKAEEAAGILEKALTLAESIDDPNSQSSALRAIAGTTGQLEKAEVAAGILEKALTLAESINNPNSQSNALSAIAGATGQLEQDEEAVGVLEKALTLAESIDNPGSQSDALSAITRATGQLEQDEEAVGVLEKALTLAESIDDPYWKSNALRAIAWATGQLGDIETALDLLIQIRRVAEQAGTSDVLSEIAPYQALYGDWQAALQSFSNGYSIYALVQMLTYHAESQKPQLIDGPVILGVEAVEEVEGKYKLSVKIQSPDKSCSRYADWWEVLSEEGELLGRKILDTPHEFERPFTTEKTLSLDPKQTILVRAHFSDDLDDNSNNGIDKYTTQAMKGKVGKPDSFESIRLPARFAISVEKDGEQPTKCEESERTIKN